MSNERADIAERWVEVCRLLNAHGAEYLVIGRVGMGLHGFDYATRDLDILVPRDRDNMTRVLDALSELPYGIARELDPATETRKMMTIVGDDPRVDVLKGAGTTNYQKAVLNLQRRLVDGVEIPYAGLDDMIDSKTTDRPRDAEDRRELTRKKEEAEDPVAR